MDDHLGVALGGEAVAVAAQAAPQLAEVVDLAVEHDGHRAILVVDGLVARDEVDHAQALDAEPDPVIEVQATSVRPAVRLRLAHALQDLALHRSAGGPCHARDPAHLVPQRSRADGGDEAPVAVAPSSQLARGRARAAHAGRSRGTPRSSTRGTRRTAERRYP